MSETKKKVLILEGQEFTGDYDEFDFSLIDDPKYDVHVMDCLYAYPQQLRCLNAIDPDYIYIFTTGFYVDYLNECIKWFKRSKHKPKAIIFHAGGSLDKLIHLAYEMIEKYNTDIYVDMDAELERQDWMYKN